LKNNRNDLSNYWINRAEALYRSAIVLYDSKNSDRIHLYDPCLLLAGLSIEVLTKAILVKRDQKFDESQFSHHKINKLLAELGLDLGKDQFATIGFFEESIFWLSKYPEPKNVKEPDKKIDSLWKKGTGPGIFGKASSPDSQRWPYKENYVKIWRTLYQLYWETPTENPKEFGYRLEGL